MMKDILFCTVIIAVLFQVCWGGSGLECTSTQATHNMTWGTRQYGDKLVFTDHPKLSSKWFRKQSVDEVYPPSGVQPSGYITKIEVIDQNHNGKGGCAFLTAGGVGQTFATLHLKTKTSEGLNFIVNIYAF